MPIKIIHTADNHLGISFRHYPEEVRKLLLQERLDALKVLVDEGNSRKAHFMVIAGDLFDKVNVGKAIIEDAADVLKRFEGEAVLVLAGNHDFYEGTESTLWQRFRKATEGSCVQALLHLEPEQFSIDDQEVIFYPCPCPSKYGTEPVIGWVKNVEKKAGAIHIGIAHGNVESLGLDNDNRYFNMNERELIGAGLHTWLLGHIHVAAPAPGIRGKQPYYMAGIHAPDSVKCTRPGHAWYLEFEADGSIMHAALHPGKLSFKRITRELRNANDIEALRQECEAIGLEHVLLDLQLSGRLAEEDLEQLSTTIDELRKKSLHLSEERDIHPVLDAEAIEKLFPGGTLPHRLLNDLAADADHPEDVHLALELIKELRP